MPNNSSSEPKESLFKAFLNRKGKPKDVEVHHIDNDTTVTDRNIIKHPVSREKWLPGRKSYVDIGVENPVFKKRIENKFYIRGFAQNAKRMETKMQIGRPINMGDKEVIFNRENNVKKMPTYINGKMIKECILEAKMNVADGPWHVIDHRTGEIHSTHSTYRKSRNMMDKLNSAHYEKTKKGGEMPYGNIAKSHHDYHEHMKEKYIPGYKSQSLGEGVINELSPETLKSFIDKSKEDINKKTKDASAVMLKGKKQIGGNYDPKNISKWKPLVQKIISRQKSIKIAQEKLGMKPENKQ